MNIYRKKLINAVLFFSKETNHTNITKLMKLLNFLDFEHFNQTGYPSIGLDYYAFDNGPVPKNFWLEVKDAELPEDLGKLVSVYYRTWGEENKKKEIEFRAKPNTKVDFDVFSPREQKILKNLAFIYKDAYAKDMSNISHEDNKPWEITRNTKGKNALIDYMLALDENSEIDPRDARESLHDHIETVKAFNIEPVNTHAK